MTDSAYRTIGLVAKPHADHLPVILPKIIELLRGNDCTVILDDKSSHMVTDSVELANRGELVERSDMIIILGGDGTLLSLAKYQKEGEEKPVLGINMGSLGFLTEIAVTEAMKMTQKALQGKLEVSYRMMLHAELIREETTQALQGVLNDVVINKSALARIFNVNVVIDGEAITSIRADGIIVSTPTGSTAYNLAANGPIVYPEMQLILLTPICPHMLTYRPVVLPGDATIDLQMQDSEETYLTLDGQAGFPLHQGDTVRIYRSRRRMAILTPRERTFFQVLRNKLKWGG